MIVSSDTDYCAYLGKDYTCLKYFKYNSTTNAISTLVLYNAADIETYYWSLVLDWDDLNNKSLLLQEA